MFICKRLLAPLVLFVCSLPHAWSQELGSDGSATPAPSATSPVPPAVPVEQAPPDKRVLGVLPNYRTANETAIYTPITTKQKLTIASKDSFDYPLILLGAAIAGLGQLQNSNPSLGQGAAGFARRFGTSYADQAIGNMLTEGFVPTLLHEDPRYFRRGYGSTWSRAWYAATRVFVTRTDAGNWRFNFSEVLGNAAGVAISNAYYPDNRTAGANLEKLGQQIGIDAFSQILKEFWPDIKRRYFERHKDQAQLH